MSEDRLNHRLNALGDAATVLQRHGFELPGDIEGFLTHARKRLGHGSDHTVVALVGSTGSGKSSLLNAVSGEEVARSSVTRPTTSVTQAVTFGIEADSLLDLIGVTRRHLVTTATPSLDGLVLLDLPDFDSVAVDHRLEVDRLIDLVDVLVWVTDPQKYADESLHVGYLQRLASYEEVMRVVLNKSDTLQGDALNACLVDLDGLLDHDGLEDTVPIPTSTVNEPGIDALTEALTTAVTDRETAMNRIRADLASHSTALSEISGAAGRVGIKAVKKNLVEGLSHAVGVDDVAALVARQHRRDAALATSWPPLQWVSRLRGAPLAELEETADSQIGLAEVSRTLRNTARQVSEQAGPSWGEAASTLLRERADDVAEALDRGVSRGVQGVRKPPGWWALIRVLHTLFLFIALAGTVWLGGLILARQFLLIDVERFDFDYHGVPIPTLLLLGGVLAGLLLSMIAHLFTSIAAKRRSRLARAELKKQVGTVADTEVIEPLNTLLADANQVTELIETAAK